MDKIKIKSSKFKIMEKEPRLYTEEQALDEAAKMQEKIKNGEVSDYNEAERIIEQTEEK